MQVLPNATDRVYRISAKIKPGLLEIANFSTKYFILSKVYTNEGSTKKLYHGLLINHLLKLVDYLFVHTDEPCYNYYVMEVLVAPLILIS